MQFADVLVPTILEKMQLEQPAAYATLGPLVRDTAAWALTLTTSDFLPGPTSSVLYALVATNATLWCGPSAADAAPGVHEAVARSFANSLPYHEVLAADEQPMVLINGTYVEEDEEPAAVPEDATAAGTPGAVAMQASGGAPLPTADSALEPTPAAEEVAAQAGPEGAKPAGRRRRRAGMGGGRLGPESAAAAGAGAQSMQREGEADAAAAAAPAPPIGGASSQAWLVPFLAVLVVGAHSAPAPVPCCACCACCVLCTVCQAAVWRCRACGCTPRAAPPRSRPQHTA